MCWYGNNILFLNRNDNKWCARVGVPFVWDNILDTKVGMQCCPTLHTLTHHMVYFCLKPSSTLHLRGARPLCGGANGPAHHTKHQYAPFLPNIVLNMHRVVLHQLHNFVIHICVSRSAADNPDWVAFMQCAWTCTECMPWEGRRAFS